MLISELQISNGQAHEETGPTNDITKYAITVTIIKLTIIMIYVHVSLLSSTLSPIHSGYY